MNERIRALFIQAGGSINEDSSNFWTNSDYLDPELFGQLVVQECAEHALTFNNNIQSLNDKEIRSHSSRVSDYIKDRMGISE